MCLCTCKVILILFIEPNLIYQFCLSLLDWPLAFLVFPILLHYYLYCLLHLFHSPFVDPPHLSLSLSLNILLMNHHSKYSATRWDPQFHYFFFFWWMIIYFILMRNQRMPQVISNSRDKHPIRKIRDEDKLILITKGCPTGHIESQQIYN